jgi:hypothetical protein
MKTRSNRLRQLILFRAPGWLGLPQLYKYDQSLFFRLLKNQMQTVRAMYT